MRAIRSRVIVTATSEWRLAVVASAAGRSFSASSASGRADSVAMSSPANVTARDSGRNRRPWHTGQATVSTNRSTRWRIVALFELASVCST